LNYIFIPKKFYVNHFKTKSLRIYHVSSLHITALHITSPIYPQPPLEFPCL